MNKKFILLLCLISFNLLAQEKYGFIISDGDFGTGYDKKNANALKKLGFKNEYRLQPNLTETKMDLMDFIKKKEGSFFISLNCHGVIPLGYDRISIQKHSCCLNPECNQRLSVEDLENISHRRNGPLAIMDDSCGSGSTPLYINPTGIDKLCVIGTSGANSVTFYNTTQIHSYLDSSDNLEEAIREAQYDRVAMGENPYEAPRTFFRINYSGCVDVSMMRFRQNYLDFNENLGEWELHGVPIFKEIYPDTNYGKEANIEDVMKVSCERTEKMKEEYARLAKVLVGDLQKHDFKIAFEKNIKRILSSYKKRKIVFPYDKMNDQYDLGIHIADNYMKAKEMHRQLEADLKLFNEELLIGKTKLNEARLLRLKDRIKLNHKEIRKNMNLMNALLNIYEEVKCSLTDNSCRRYEL